MASEKVISWVEKLRPKVILLIAWVISIKEDNSVFWQVILHQVCTLCKMFVVNKNLPLCKSLNQIGKNKVAKLLKFNITSNFVQRVRWSRVFNLKQHCLLLKMILILTSSKISISAQNPSVACADKTIFVTSTHY